MPFLAFAQSLCVLTDIMIDSVPPDVVVPAPVGLLYLKEGKEMFRPTTCRQAEKI